MRMARVKSLFEFGRSHREEAPSKPKTLEKPGPVTSAPPMAPGSRKLLRAIVVVLLVAALIWALYYFMIPSLLQRQLARGLDWVANLGLWGPLVFLILYVLACVCFIPGSILTLGAGALFGVIKGTIMVSLSATLGATAAFLVGRYLARDWVARKIERNPKFRAIDKAVAEEGWKIVLLTRLSPVFPFNLLNYAFGLTRIRLRDYVLASWIGTLPGTVLYVYVGSLAHVGARHTTTAEWVLRGVGLLATLAVTIVLTRVAKKALNKRTIQ
jgi:uncharacterized membrane protein YdjX (TVP38/TMEM64 family)